MQCAQQNTCARFTRSQNLAMLRTTFALFIAATLAFISAAENGVIFFSLIVSWGENGYNSSGVVPAIDMALEAIESRQILPEYNLTYAIVQNSKVVYALVQHLIKVKSAFTLILLLF